MILIADGGSTKTRWCLLEMNGHKDYFDTEGYNPYFVGRDYILGSLHKNLLPLIENHKITRVNFYGAGCLAEKTSIVEDALQLAFPKAQVYVAVDLLGAAKALLGTKPGFAAILGTGTNSCVYNGKEIVLNTHSLGFILGDEGSGGYIGKKLISDYIRNYLPEELRRKFWDTYQLSPDEIMNHIYTQPLANRFCAEFSRFVSENIKHEYAYNLLKSAFEDFFANLVTKYPSYQDYSFNCIGSVAFNHRNILAEVAMRHHMAMGKILQSPMEGLINYHLETLNQE